MGKPVTKTADIRPVIGIIVFGDTSFSDYSFAPSSFHDNEHFLPSLIEWVLFDDISGGISYIPQVIITTETIDFTDSITIEYTVSTNTDEVELVVDGSIQDTDDSKPFDSFTFDLTGGSYNITLKAKNALEQYSSDSLLITVTSTSSTTTSSTTTETPPTTALTT